MNQCVRLPLNATGRNANGSLVAPARPLQTTCVASPQNRKRCSGALLLLGVRVRVRVRVRRSVEMLELRHARPLANRRRKTPKTPLRAAVRPRAPQKTRAQDGAEIAPVHPALAPMGPALLIVCPWAPRLTAHARPPAFSPSCARAGRRPQMVPVRCPPWEGRDNSAHLTAYVQDTVRQPTSLGADLHPILLCPRGILRPSTFAPRHRRSSTSAGVDWLRVTAHRDHASRGNGNAHCGRA
jgi:hypothetical protein